MQFLSRQGLAFRGNDNEGNFEQLMKLGAKVDPGITSWMKKKQEKYIHHDTQNEIVRLMAFIILRDIAKNINDSIFYWIMAHEVTDCSNKEQFVICFRWVYKGFDTHEDFIGIYNVDKIKADAVVTAIKDVLIRLNIPLSNARGQCYDGQRIYVVLKMVFLINFISKSKSIFHTLFWAYFKFGCWRYGEECTIFERQYGHNIRNFQSY